MKPTLPVLVLCVAALWSAAAVARPIKPTSVSASSTYPEEEGVNYEAKNVSDLKASTVWVENASGSGLNESITVDLGESKSVYGLKIWNGNWYSADFWKRHNRIKELEVEFADGTKQSFTLKDEQVPEALMFPKAVSTSTVKLKVKSVYSGTTFGDATVISELQVLDNQPDDYIVPASASASSTFPSDADGSYEPHLMYDGLVDTMWCEGKKDGDGTGEWVELNFGGSKSVSKVRVNNGNATSLKDNMNANKATAVTLQFDDGSTQQLTLKASPSAQTLSFVAKTTSKVKITVNTVQKGTTYNDMCLSEVQFLP